MLPKWFSRYRDKISWVEFNQNLEIDLHHNYVYFEVPKVACSTVKARMRPLAAPNIPLPKEIHPMVTNSPFAKPFQLPPRIMRNVLAGKGFTRFTFVREPVERAVSAYLDKMCRLDAAGNFSGQKKRFMARFLPEIPEDSYVSFDQFIDVIATVNDPKLLDKHWRQQTALLLQPEQEFDFIGRFDRFEDDWDKLVDLLGLSIRIEKASITWHSTSASSKVDNIVTPYARRKIENIYADDFDFYANLK